MLPVGAPTRLGVKPLPWPRWLENSSALETALLREPCFGVGLCRDPLRAFPRIFAHFFFAVQPWARSRIFRLSNRPQFVSAKPIFGASLAEDSLRYAALANDEHPLRFIDGAHPLPYAEFLRALHWYTAVSVEIPGLVLHPAGAVKSPSPNWSPEVIATDGAPESLRVAGMLLVMVNDARSVPLVSLNPRTAFVLQPTGAKSAA